MMKLSEKIRRENYPWGDPDWLPALEQLESENEALGELLSPLVDVELERDTFKAALDVAMSENQRLTKIVEDYLHKQRFGV